MSRKESLYIGYRSGRLVIIERLGIDPKQQNRLYLCKCDCGEQKTLVGGRLQSGNDISCGCLNREKAAERNAQRKIAAEGKTELQVLERFLAKVDKNGLNGCWMWTAGCFGDKGYGAFGVRINGKTKNVGAHKWSYEHFVGPVPEGEMVLHACDVRSCVNPAHLKVGPTQQNAKEAAERGLYISGEDHHMRKKAKLLQGRNDEIRTRYANERITQVQLAQEYSLSIGTIGRIVRS